MAFNQYLIFDGERLPLLDSYDVELKDVEVNIISLESHLFLA